MRHWKLRHRVGWTGEQCFQVVQAVNKELSSQRNHAEIQAGLNTQDLASRLHAGTSGPPLYAAPSAYQDSSSSGGSSGRRELPSSSPSSPTLFRTRTSTASTTCATLTKPSRRRRRHYLALPPTDPDPATPPTLLSRHRVSDPTDDRCENAHLSTHPHWT